MVVVKQTAKRKLCSVQNGKRNTTVVPRTRMTIDRVMGEKEVFFCPKNCMERENLMTPQYCPYIIRHLIATSSHYLFLQDSCTPIPTL